MMLRSGVHVVVGTPGRIYDLLRRRALISDKICMFILDEADTLLGQDFKDQIFDIYHLLPANPQVGIFCATLSPEALHSTRKFMREPVCILLKRDQLTLVGIKQFRVNVVKEEFKFATLRDLYSILPISQAVI